MYHILYHKNNFFFALFLNCAVDGDDDGVLVDDYPLKISIRQQKKKKKGTWLYKYIYNIQGI